MVIADKYKKVVAEKGKSQWLDRKSNVSSFISALKEHFPKLEGLKILDAGCAQGRDTAEISKLGVNVEGIDYNKEFIKEATKEHPSISFHVDNIEKLSYQDGSFDAIYCVNTLFYLKPQQSLPEIERVLKKGGMAFITLDKSIFNMDEKKEIHSLDVDKALKIFKHMKVVKKEYLERVDTVPFKHKHFFYEITLIKEQ